ncbi:hypothetical protein H4582DRAFT_652830 [Lactarius indigo]|nr:hypothetical protein H4582DRAFT_652830 [Lactarius indigo]
MHARARPSQHYHNQWPGIAESSLHNSSQRSEERCTFSRWNVLELHYRCALYTVLPVLLTPLWVFASQHTYPPNLSHTHMSGFKKFAVMGMGHVGTGHVGSFIVEASLKQKGSGAVEEIAIVMRPAFAAAEFTDISALTTEPGGAHAV